MCLYIPSEDIMVKLMRSCLYVEKVQDLFVYYNADNKIANKRWIINKEDLKYKIN